VAHPETRLAAGAGAAGGVIDRSLRGRDMAKGVPWSGALGARTPSRANRLLVDNDASATPARSRAPCRREG
jgi:hypothetical protein